MVAISPDQLHNDAMSQAEASLLKVSYGAKILGFATLTKNAVVFLNANNIC